MSPSYQDTTSRMIRAARHHRDRAQSMGNWQMSNRYQQRFVALVIQGSKEYAAAKNDRSHVGVPADFHEEADNDA